MGETSYYNVIQNIKVHYKRPSYIELLRWSFIMPDCLRREYSVKSCKS